MSDLVDLENPFYDDFYDDAVAGLAKSRRERGSRSRDARTGSAKTTRLCLAALVATMAACGKHGAPAEPAHDDHDGGGAGRELPDGAVATRDSGQVGPVGGDCEDRTPCGTGFFRLERGRERWWLITPEGRRFVALGMSGLSDWNYRQTVGDAVFTAQYPPVVDSSRWVCDGVHDVLPRPSLCESVRAWGDVAIERLRDWGFNSLGRDSYPLTFNPMTPAGGYDGAAPSMPLGGRLTTADIANLDAAMPLPFIAEIDFAPLGGTANRQRHLARYPEDLSFAFPDVWSGEWARHVERMAGVIEERRLSDNPWLIGYVTNNELVWGNPIDGAEVPGIGRGAWAQTLLSTSTYPPGSPCRTEFVELMMSRYSGSTDAFEALWGVEVVSWWMRDGSPSVEELSIDPLMAMPPAGLDRASVHSDLRAYMGQVADQYGATVAAAIRERDPHHLILGSTFAGGSLESAEQAEHMDPPEAIAAIAHHADVVSIQMYKRLRTRGGDNQDIATWPAELARLMSDVAGYYHEASGSKPIIVQELSAFDRHYCAAQADGDCGFAWAAFVDGQARRAAYYRAYLDAFYSLVGVDGLAYGIGTFWYRYYDLENSAEHNNYGLVDLENHLYDETVAGIAETNAEVRTRLAIE